MTATSSTPSAPDAARRCPICGAAPVGEFTPRALTVLKCGDRRCGHIFAKAPAPDQGVQSGRDHRAESEAFRERNARLVGAWLANGFIGPESRVLDFGSGSGHIGMAVRERVRAVTCVEADTRAQLWLRENGLDLRSSLAECDRGYDAALLVEVIEHLGEPIALLREIRSHLRIGGRVFLSTPCGETRLGDRRTNAYDTPEHVQFFTERSLALAARAAGFGGVRFLYLPEIYPLPPAGARAALSVIRHRIVMPLLIGIRGYTHLVAYLD